MPEAKIQRNIYHAAELFHGPATLFNANLVHGLEKKGHRVFSPQRDGFEFSQLATTLGSKLPTDTVKAAVQRIIYARDLKAIIDCDVVVARVDEPMDSGVDIEMSFARKIGKPVIIYRTDARSPYGDASEDFSGAHFFPMFQATEAIIFPMPSRTPIEAKRDMRELVNLLHTRILNLRRPSSHLEGPLPDDVRTVLEITKKLFDNIEDIHTEEGLVQIAKNYLHHEALMNTLSPVIIRRYRS